VVSEASDREHDRIWWVIESQTRTLQEHGEKLNGIEVLNERLSQLITSVGNNRSAKRWIIVQFIATCGVLTTLLGFIIHKG
jgi:hypothetical protein